jgi:ribose transport system ATP-binding protein
VSIAARLALSGVRKSFGATQALKSVSLEIAPGEVHALIGENGAGKSTLLKILSGAHPADEGQMTLDGAPYQPAGPADARARGVAMIYQEINLAPHLSVRENILLGAESSALGWIDIARSRARAQAALAGLGYGHFPLERAAGDFTIAEQQVIEIARALLLQPKVLIMDEPTSSLTKADTEKLFAVIGRLRTQGVSVIYVSHFLEECRRICDRYTVLKDGEAVARGAMAGAEIGTLVVQMTGRPVADLYPRTERALGAAVLETRGLARAPRLKPVSLQRARRRNLRPRRGSSARAAPTSCAACSDSTTARGRRRCWSSGRPTERAQPRDRWAQGLGFLSENRKEEGLMLNQLDQRQYHPHEDWGLREARAGSAAAGRRPPGALDGRARDQVPRRDAARRRTLRRQPAEGRLRPAARAPRAHTPPRRADARHRRREQGADLRDHRPGWRPPARR